MLNRCNNPNTPNFARYGGRGIAHQASWSEFSEFLRDMGVRPAGTTLDRKDNDGNYTADNCRWATASEQQQNKASFTQPTGRTYGSAYCRNCGVSYVRTSPVSVNCPEHKRCRK